MHSFEIYGCTEYGIGCKIEFFFSQCYQILYIHCLCQACKIIIIWWEKYMKTNH